MADLSSAKAKLARALKHINDANEMSKAFFNTGFHKLAVRPQKNGKNRYFIITKRVDAIPIEFSLAVGDAAHNMRAALDHIAYTFAKFSGRKEEKLICFPLVSSPGEFAKRAPEALRGVPRRARALIRSMQPYHGRQGSMTKALGQIQAIDNRDKHRSLLVAAVGNSGPSFHIRTEPDVPVVNLRVFKNKVLKLNAIVARFQFAPRESVVVKPKVIGKLEIFPVFAAMPDIRNGSIFDVLSKASALIAAKITEFEKFA